MAEAKVKHNWTHTSSVLAMIANVNRDKKKKPSPFKPDDFNPFAKKTKTDAVRADTPEGLAAMRKEFTGA